jgi:hypothetical protein
MLVGFTLALSEAGKIPLSMLTVNQKSVGGIAVLNVGFPELALTETVCALGSFVAPTW